MLRILSSFKTISYPSIINNYGFGKDHRALSMFSTLFSNNLVSSSTGKIPYPRIILGESHHLSQQCRSMNRNARRPKKANHGKRPVSHARRWEKRKLLRGAAHKVKIFGFW